MDPTPACRDKCASSGDQLSCLRDCTGGGPALSAAAARAGPVNPIYQRMAAIPKLFRDITINVRTAASSKDTLAKVVIVVAAVAGGVWLYKNKKATGKWF
jgi:hypothetical protein